MFNVYDQGHIFQGTFQCPRRSTTSPCLLVVYLLFTTPEPTTSHCINIYVFKHTHKLEHIDIMPGYRSSRRTNYNTETMAPVDQRNKSKLVTVACLIGAAVIVGMINFSAEMVSVSTIVSASSGTTSISPLWWVCPTGHLRF